MYDEDGTAYHNHGLGYGSIRAWNQTKEIEHDIYEFKESLSWQHRPGMRWSQYACAAVPIDKSSSEGHRRPGRRNYCELNCEPYGWLDPCSDVDITVPSYYREDCKWWWTGSQCFFFVAYCLKEADVDYQNRFSGLICTDLDCAWLLNYLLENNLGEVCDRSEALKGDLVFMDLTGVDQLGPVDHVAIISGFGFLIENDYTMGNLGFYKDPFYYKAHEASNAKIDEVLYDEWWWHCENPLFLWGMYYENFVYFHIYY